MAHQEGTLGERHLNPIVFLDIQIGDRAVGRLTIELRADIVPKTAENFRALCTGENGCNKDGSTLMHFKGTPFHRIVKDLLCQSGDIKCRDGTWSQSIYNVPTQEQKFVDENFILRHAGPGVLSCVNSGPDTNGSAFYISFIECEWMNDKHVVFGCVCNEEAFAVLFELERQGSLSGQPKKAVVISDCGQLYP
mmetsp:Transcript_67254/g.115492  ORF Transcript_67254/g.115492 Transcript_67254/m.115492 type:complete len:193 (+) Transcript_67254:32-610(+)